MSVLAFRPVARADYPALRAWLTEPHIAAWWGPPDREIALIEETLTGADPTRGFIALLDDAPVGYAQAWRPADYDDDAEPWMRAEAPETRAIDVFLSTDGLGRGAAVVRAFAARIFDEGAPRIVIDPDAANARAIRAYEKAGFRRIGPVATSAGDAMLMAMNRTDLEDSE